MGVESFAHPEWRWAVGWVLLASAIALGFAGWRSRALRARLLGRGGAPRSRRLESDAVLWIGLAAISLALLGPRIGERTLRVPGDGVDVVFAIDVSRSMDARDVPPSRLDRARRATQELLDRLQPGDRAALAVFAGRGVLLTPLTPDRDALGELLSGIDSDLIQPPASDLGAGVRAALEAFEVTRERPAVIFVVSDGEDSGGDRELAAAEASRAGVRVLAAALGSELGAQVPDHDLPLRDAAGDVVVSRRRSERLETLTANSDGALFVADGWGAFDFDEAARALRRDAASAPGQMVERRVSAVRVAPFAALAFLLLALEGMPRLSRGRWMRAGAAVAGGAVLLGSAPGAGETPLDARALLDAGLARLDRGQTDSAARAFVAAAVVARDPRTRAIAYYDLGVAELERGDLDAARDAFFDALAADPSDGQARFNLEWTLMALDHETPPPPPEPPPRPEAAAEPPPDESGEREERDEKRPETPPPPPQTLDEEQQERWLSRVSDDPGPSLRDAARGDAASRRSSGPAW